MKFNKIKSNRVKNIQNQNKSNRNKAKHFSGVKTLPSCTSFAGGNKTKHFVQNTSIRNKDDENQTV